jgi:gliding motility-associated-like protein
MTDINGCSNTGKILINAWAKPIADFEYTPLKPIENTDEVEFTNTSKGENIKEWNWYFMSDVYNPQGFYSNKEHVNYLFKEAGIFPVALSIRNNKGCGDTVIKKIIIEEDFNVFVPNTFTPNNDKLNDEFLPIVRGITDYKFYIMNRWDELLFETTNPSKGWDGTNKGINCKQDV